MRRQAANGYARAKVLDLLRQGWTGTLTQLADLTNVNPNTMRGTVYAMRDNGEIAAIGEVKIPYRMQKNQPHRTAVAIVYGCSPVAVRVEVPRSSADVQRAMRSVEHLPRWLGGQADSPSILSAPETAGTAVAGRSVGTAGVPVGAPGCIGGSA